MIRRAARNPSWRSDVNLHLQTWQEVEAYLQRSKGIIVPIGSTEQHGPNGLIGTDAICAEVIGRGAGEEAGALVGPTISVGMAQHHMAFTGSITLRPSTLIAVIGDYVASLARHGFERFYFINAHGGNIATAQAAFSEIYAASSLRRGGNAPVVRCKLANWWEMPRVRALSKELFGDREGSHATPSEVSVTQYAYPEAIKRVANIRLGPAARPFADGDHYRQLYPEGHIGSDPSLATPEHGERLYRVAVGDVAEDYRAFLKAA
jgi:creatinine amidohydrolase